MVEPNKFPIPSEAATASYDWNDLASGAGYATFYFTTARTTSGIIYQISEKDKRPEGAAATSGDITIGTSGQDYDTSEFNLPRKIKGDVIISYVNDAPSSIAEKWELIHVDVNDTETTIGAEIQTGNDSVDASHNIVWRDVEQQIKKGEKIRVTVTAVNANHVLRTTWSSTNAYAWTLEIPFDIDL